VERSVTVCEPATAHREFAQEFVELGMADDAACEAVMSQQNGQKLEVEPIY